MSLIFTLSFLLIFGLLSNGALENYVHQKTSLIRFKSSYDLQMRDQNNRERLLFEEAKTERITKNEESAPVNARHVKSDSVEPEMGLEEPTSNTHETRYHFKKGLNLYQLLQENTANKNLEDVFFKLFERLYQGQAFYSENLAQDLLKEIRKLATTSKDIKQKKHKIARPEELAALNLNNPKLQNALYKVLKGCQVEGSEKGYPSLCDYLIIHNKPPVKINLYQAPYDLVAVLLDDETAQYIEDNKALWAQKTKATNKDHGEQVLADIAKHYGKDFSKKSELVIFRIRSK